MKKKDLIFNLKEMTSVTRYVLTFVEQNELTESNDPKFVQRIRDAIASSIVDLKIKCEDVGTIFLLCNPVHRGLFPAVPGFRAKNFLSSVSATIFTDAHVVPTDAVQESVFLIGCGRADGGYIVLDAMNEVSIVSTFEVDGKRG